MKSKLKFLLIGFIVVFIPYFLFFRGGEEEYEQKGELAKEKITSKEYEDFSLVVEDIKIKEEKLEELNQKSFGKDIKTTFKTNNDLKLNNEQVYNFYEDFIETLILYQKIDLNDYNFSDKKIKERRIKTNNFLIRDYFDKTELKEFELAFEEFKENIKKDYKIEDEEFEKSLGSFEEKPIELITKEKNYFKEQIEKIRLNSKVVINHPVLARQERRFRAFSEK